MSLCIMRRPPQGTKSRLRTRGAGCGLNESGDGWMVDHAVVADNDDVDLSRRKFLTRATIATGAVGAVFAAVPFIESWSPSERARAQGAPTELDLSKIDPGQMAITIWRRQPIYVVRRTPDMVGRISGHDEQLKDPESKSSNQPPYATNTQRSRTPEYLVVIGICTHLGCLPKQRFEKGELYASWPGGFFCPCHGSRFDLAGRVFDGSPASINLNIPRYSYPNPTTLTIGVDEKGAA
jgi:ubiquinol-cytochrome c reductase iron-sulfur subunit